MLCSLSPSGADSLVILQSRSLARAANTRCYYFPWWVIVFAKVIDATGLKISRLGASPRHHSLALLFADFHNVMNRIKHLELRGPKPCTKMPNSII